MAQQVTRPTGGPGLEAGSIWVSGLSSSGKSTLAKLLVARLREYRFPCALIDGDEIRELYGDSLGYDLASRRKQTERVLKLAGWLSRQGVLGVVAIIHPSEADRVRCKNTLGGYFEIHLKCPVEVCVERDTKNVYLPVLNGDSKDVVGVDIAYDEPVSANLVLESDKLIPEQLLEQSWKAVTSALGLQSP